MGQNWNTCQNLTEKRSPYSRYDCALPEAILKTINHLIKNHHLSYYTTIFPNLV